jgi:hypothetical protein
MRSTTIGRRKRLRSVLVLSLTSYRARSTNMPRTIESLQQIMHGLYPASKYPQGLTPQLLIRCVPVPFCRTGKLAFHRILGVLHPCLHDRATCESLFFARFLVKLYLFTVNVSLPIFTFRNSKDENLIANQFACKRLERMNVAFAQGIPQDQ